MYWAKKLIQPLDKNLKHRVDDMKTLSGMPHIGSLRSILTHDIIYKIMKEEGFNVDFTYVFNSLDPMDGLPVYHDQNEYLKHMGKPLSQIPSPVAGFESYGHYYAEKYREVFNKLGATPKIYWSHEMYKEGKFNDVIKIALDNREEIRKIYFEVAKKMTPENWHPFQVICPNCGKIGTSFVSDWDGKEVTYECKEDLVKWAKGCGHKGKISPYNGNGKLFWKVDWPAHWVVLNITVEGAGKDHFTQGGSRDFGVEIMNRVFKVKPPHGFMHEFLTVGGKKMSSSKGSGLGADKAIEVLPPELVRFLITRVPYKRSVSFDPNVPDSIPDLFDEYDRCKNAYYDNTDEDLAEAYKLAQVNELSNEKPFLPRFKSVVAYVQMPNLDLDDVYQKEKGSKLTDEDKKVIDERAKYAKIYLENYADEKDKFSFTKYVPDLSLSSEELFILKGLIAIIIKNNDNGADILQNAIFEYSKETNYGAKQMFALIYKLLLNKSSGPKAGWLIKDIGTENVLERFNHYL